MNNIIIKIENLYKLYKLGSIGGGTLYADLNSWWSKVRGKEDPYMKIGANQQINNGTIVALNGINLEVRQGDKLGIIGINGSGKSTLLKILSRVTAPTSGQIKMKGRIASLLEVGTGFHPELTGRENIYLNGAILGMKKSEVDKKFDNIVSFSEIEPFIDTPVKRYSSGMYVRLAFAVAAHLDPEILLVDEVLAVGDYQFQQKCLGKMNDISKGGRTVLFVSHQLSMIKTLCNRCALLDHGKLIKFGNANQVIDYYIQQKTDLDLISRAELKKDLQKAQAQLYKAVLKNKDGKECSVFEIFDQIYLEVEYEIKKSLVGVSLGFSVYKNMTAQFHSFDTDIDSNLLNKREVGFYKAQVNLPTVLKAGHYIVDFTICRPNLDGLDYNRNLLSFVIQEKSINTSMCSYSTRRDGNFSARLKWKHSKLSG